MNVHTPSSESHHRESTANAHAQQELKAPLISGVETIIHQASRAPHTRNQKHRSSGRSLVNKRTPHTTGHSPRRQSTYTMAKHKACSWMPQLDAAAACRSCMPQLHAAAGCRSWTVRISARCLRQGAAASVTNLLHTPHCRRGRRCCSRSSRLVRPWRLLLCTFRGEHCCTPLQRGG